MNTSDAGGALEVQIDAIEAAYELFLSYAARGTDGRKPAGADADVRDRLGRALAAMDRLEAAARAAAGEDAALHAWIDVLAADIARSRAGLALVRSRAAISSQLVDNLNASIHLRALLTDLFVLDEALKTNAQPG